MIPLCFCLYSAPTGSNGDVVKNHKTSNQLMALSYCLGNASLMSESLKGRDLTSNRIRG
jgi:hypothetical protein